MDDVKYFPYGEKELAYLRKKDKKLSAVIDRVGHIERAVDDDLFSAVVPSGHPDNRPAVVYGRGRPPGGLLERGV